MMRVPGNYYVDLDARFGLEPALLDALREHSMQYDRIGTGELLHAYTRVLDAGFNVEVQERRGDYDAYGSASTHVRLAAQAQLPSSATQPSWIPTAVVRGVDPAVSHPGSRRRPALPQAAAIGNLMPLRMEMRQLRVHQARSAA